MSAVTAAAAGVCATSTPHSLRAAAAASPHVMTGLVTAQLKSLTLQDSQRMSFEGRVAPLATALRLPADIIACLAAADDAEAFIHAYSDPTRRLMFPGPVVAIIESFGGGDDYQKAIVSKLLSSTSPTNSNNADLEAARKRHDDNTDEANILLYVRLMRQLIETAKKDKPVAEPAGASSQSAPVKTVQQPVQAQPKKAALTLPLVPQPLFSAIADELLLLVERFETRKVELAKITEFPALEAAPNAEQSSILRALLRYCPNINTIRFDLLNDYYNSVYIASDEALLLLPQFRNLAHLSFVSKRATPLYINGTLLLQILPQLSQLEHFAHNHDFRSCDNSLVSVDQLLEVMPQSVYWLEVTSAPPFSSLHDIKRCSPTLEALSRLPALRWLSVSCLVLTSAHIAKLPRGLKWLQCHIENNAIPTLANACPTLEYCHFIRTEDDQRYRFCSPITGEHFGTFPQTLRKFSCNYLSAMSDAWMEHFSRYPQLESLTLEINRDNRYDDAFKSFQGATLQRLPLSLQSLTIRNAQYFRSRNVGHFTQLRELDVSGTSINYATLPPSVVKLTAREVFTDQALLDLRSHNNLQELHVADSRELTGVYSIETYVGSREYYLSFSHLPPNIRVFDCSGCRQITDDGMRILYNHKALTHLIMNWTDITGMNVHLLPLQLKYFSIQSCSKIDQSKIQWLHDRNRDLLKKVHAEREQLLQDVPPSARAEVAKKWAKREVPVLEIVT